MRYIKLLLLAVALGVLLWLFGRRRDRDFEYPEQPEPLQPWWTYSTNWENEPVYGWGGRTANNYAVIDISGLTH